MLSDRDEEELLKLCRWFKDYPQYCSFSDVTNIMLNKADYTLTTLADVEKTIAVATFRRISEIVEKIYQK